MSKLAHTPQLRLPEFGETLRQATLGDFGYFYYGKSAPKWSITEDSETPCVRYGELYSTFGEYISEIKSHTNIPSENLKFSKGGEVLVPRVGEDPLDFANCSYLPIPNVAIGEMISVYNTKENGLFFTYYINAKLRKAFARVVEGGNVSNLYYKYLEDIKLTIPEEEEQQKIAAFLTTVDNKIEQLSKKQELLGEYKKGLMQQIFSQEIRFKANDGSEFPEWEEKKLGGVGRVRKGSQLNKSELTDTGDCPAINGGINPSGYTDKWNTGKNTITISEGGNSCGYINFITSKFWSGGHCYSIEELKDDVLNRFLFQYLKFNEHLIMRLRVGGALPNIQKGEINNFKVNLPSLEEQTKISNFLSSIDNKIEQVGKQLDESKQFKKALLQQMFV